jgi:hypothetical protein
MKRKPIFSMIALICLAIMLSASTCDAPDSDEVQKKQQETILAEITAAVGMPAIKNAREKRILKDIYELRDQEGLVTYTYIFCEATGKYTYIGETIGYGISCATQFTNPQKIEHYTAIPQADPNGLFSPTSAEGTWVMMYDPINKKASPQYIESRISVFTFRLPARLVMAGY